MRMPGILIVAAVAGVFSEIVGPTGVQCACSGAMYTGSTLLRHREVIENGFICLVGSFIFGGVQLIDCCLIDFILMRMNQLSERNLLLKFCQQELRIGFKHILG